MLLPEEGLMFSLHRSLDVTQGQSDGFWRTEESCLWLQAGCAWFRVRLVNQTMDIFSDQLGKMHQILSEIFRETKVKLCRSQWPHGLRRRSAAARLLRSWVQIPPGAWMFVCCECCMLSGRGLCDELITRPEESYRLWCAVVCDL